MTDNMTPGQRLAELRRDAGLTQAELARRCDAHVMYISKLETGRADLSGIALIRAIQIADALGIDNPRDLLPDYNK